MSIIALCAVENIRKWRVKMKKFLLIALSSVLALGMLTACGETNQAEPENEPVTPPDLVGEWKQQCR